MKASKPVTINKWVLGGIIVAAVGATAVYVSKQVAKIMNYTLTFKTIKVNKMTRDTLDFNVYYDYTNKSDIDIKLASQEYDVYINDVYIQTLRNYTENVLKANAVSELGFNVNLNLPELDKKIRVNYFNMITDPKKVKIRIDMKWRVRFGIFKIPVNYTWNTNMKEILGWYLPIYRK